ncbi:DUF7674 family protein [Pseudoalteromonas luteoviolacea]|uniref:DUF7674 domain-containing protein n=1 Tax=Pseudoalteromonas luteoviolacea S4054 TaxID=1129367 RepID=A0A0F6ABK4_9GAMM|nr:hypothetical protein [Pseudoalteromonas luteoviolacea]AOT08843.1 hypothetical protein S4054249_13695 [Pseudoalteromonas luteoviolacea]AOT13756.1 hypothetical protein S40542_13665 [Pseudoalteromonas luteoviolacea]AOT18670.1 hypothetical protein S4054_13670 [Pseudoalteromonas luteoviolacea]KKE83592.1 hypothetical protein N479_13105 [Pseudoalteromonas luteoviolacea S4054]KZN72781.1 hypothetical protein N481_14240 [Pseudoalteromonas luteoviolacea S4047-1]
MNVLDMFYEFRKRFEEVTQKADREHIFCWGELDPEYAYSWFESVAKAINIDMMCDVEATQYLDVFEYFEKKCINGNHEIRGCIDASFSENLFWQVPREKAHSYWAVLPNLLKDFYVGFHNCKPV